MVVKEAFILNEAFLIHHPTGVFSPCSVPMSRGGGGMFYIVDYHPDGSVFAISFP